MKKTFKELQNIDNVVGGLYKRFPHLETSKFGYAYKRFAEKNFYPYVKEYSREQAFLRIEHAMEDPKTKQIVVDNGSARGFAYTKEGLRAVYQAELDLLSAWEAKEFEVEPYITSVIPDELNDDQKEILKGILIA